MNALNPAIQRALHGVRVPQDAATPSTNASERVNNYGNVGDLFSGAPEAPADYKVAKGMRNEKLNNYGNVGDLFSGAPDAPADYKVAKGMRNEKLNNYGNVGDLFSGAPEAPANYKVAKGIRNEKLNNYGNVGDLFSGAPNAPANYTVARGSEPITNKNILNRTFQLTGAQKGSEPISPEKLSKLLKLYNNSKNDKEKARLKLLASVGKYNTAENAKTAKNRFGLTKRSVKEVNGKHILSGGRRRLPKSRKTRKARR
jgi:hypothetical protein